MSSEEFQEGGHLGYRNRTILDILNLCVTVMPPIVSAQSDLGFRRRCCLKNLLQLPIIKTFPVSGFISPNLSKRLFV